jgi:nucleotide-binding universal stress UspA family protein
MTKNILCAIDISDPTRDIPVLKIAAKMAAQEDAQLDLVTVVPDFGMSVVGSFFDSDHHEAAMVEAKKRLNAIALAELGEEVNAGVRHIVATGKAYEQTLKTAKASGTDLIVIGANAPDLADYLLGPNAARIVRHATCSVYVVR